MSCEQNLLRQSLSPRHLLEIENPVKLQCHVITVNPLAGYAHSATRDYKSIPVGTAHPRVPRGLGGRALARGRCWSAPGPGPARPRDESRRDLVQLTSMRGGDRDAHAAIRSMSRMTHKRTDIDN